MTGSDWLRTIVVILCVAVGLALPVQAADDDGAGDQIVLKNGSRLLGKVTGSRDGVVTLETDFAGTLEISMDKIDSLQTREVVTMLLEDDTVIRDQPLDVEERHLVLATGVDQSTSYNLDQLRVVNPEPWELGQGYNWTGLVDFAMVMERGNTDTDELDYKLHSVWLSTLDRYTFQWTGENDEANGQKTADKWQVLGKYDYFLTDPNFWGMLVAAEKDKFADLDFRFVIGPYLGRQFYDQPLLSLSGELGLSYVTEEFNVAEDQDYPASNWALDMSSNYLGGNSRLYLNQLGIWNLEETSDVIVKTTLGLSFPLLWSLEAAAEVLLDYDSGAVEGVDELDQTYKVRVGYTW